jgi:hypothetical protein
MKTIERRGPRSLWGKIVMAIKKYANAAAKGPEELHRVLEFERRAREAAAQRTREKFKDGLPPDRRILSPAT